MRVAARQRLRIRVGADELNALHAALHHVGDRIAAAAESEAVRALVGEHIGRAEVDIADELKVPHEKVNVNGGACALGHPIGASGARIIVTLLHALQARGKKKGLATLCIGGGEATAMAIELV